MNTTEQLSIILGRRNS